MQNSLDSAHISQDVSKKEQKNVPYYNGECIAKIFKYYWHLQNPRIKQCPPLKLISGKVLYELHPTEFDKFAEISQKNNFDVESYIKYCVKCGITQKLVLVAISSTTMLDKYKAHIARISKKKKIYQWFMKSVKNIVVDCLKFGCYTTKEYLRLLIKSNKLANYIISGKISIYYFAAIPNFDRVIEKLDHFSKKELSMLHDHFEIYHSEINKAFIYAKNCKINPLDFTDRAIIAAKRK